MGNNTICRNTFSLKDTNFYIFSLLEHKEDNCSC